MPDKSAPLIDFVACETYLGRPFTAQPSPEILNQTVSECNLIIRKFLQNLHNQLASGTRLCLAVPAWRMPRGDFKHLPLLDTLSNLGYTEEALTHSGNQPLIYSRADQIVGRQLLLLTKS